MKKLLSLVLVVLICLSVVPLAKFMSTASGSIEIGDTITLGKYNDEPITWVCVDVDENGPLMLSEKVICQKEYDAAGKNSKYHSDGWGYIREERGSNCWEDSNIRQWLNTSGKVDYSHCPPSYKNEGGFMSNFTIAELSVVKKVSHKVTMVKYDSTRNGYCDGGTTDVFSYGKSFNIDNCYHKLLEDSFMLLDASQINRLKNSNSPYLSCGSSYFTAAISGNNYACFELVGTYDGGTNWACKNNGIRPAFYLDVEVYEEKINEIFLEGYDYTHDQYGFINAYKPNGAADTISSAIYRNMYGPVYGSLLYWREEANGAHGVCYGFAATTGTLLKNRDKIESFYIETDEGFSNSEFLSDITDPYKTYSTWTMTTLEDYIKMAHIYQFNPVAEVIEKNNSNDLIGLWKAVKNNVANNGTPILISVWNKSNNGDLSNGHTVLAIGYREENDKYIVITDNPNKRPNDEKLHPQTLEINKDFSTWKYGMYSSEAGLISYEATDVYSIGNNISPTMWNITSLLIKAKKMTSSDKELIQITSTSDEKDSESNEDDRLYWTKEDINEITLTAGEDDFITVADTYSAISSTLSNGKRATFTVDDEATSKFVGEYTIDEEVKIVFTTVDKENNLIDITVEGTALSETVAATQSKTGIVVDGFSDGIVTLSKNDEVIATQTIIDAESNMEIIYDKNGENDDLVVRYETHEHSYTSSVTKESTCTQVGTKTFTCSCSDSYTETIPATGHKDTNGDYKCDNGCGYEYEKPAEPETPSDPSENCDCNCHASGIKKFFFNFILFFQKLFKKNAVCDCGVAHY